MKVSRSRLEGLLVIEPQVYGDARGFFIESWSQRRYAAAGVPAEFVQDNVSRSGRGTLRGLHLQLPPRAQGKLVTVLEGEVFDVAVDVRPESTTFGQWVAETLSAGNQKQVYVPPGFAHGFCVLSESALFTYKCSDYYAPDTQLSLRWDDPELAIAWPIGRPLLSEKDRAGIGLQELRAHMQRAQT